MIFLSCLYMAIECLEYEEQKDLADEYGVDIDFLPYEMDAHAYRKFRIPKQPTDKVASWGRILF